MKPCNGEGESNKDAKGEDVQVSKTEGIRSLVRAEALPWLAWLPGGRLAVQGEMPRRRQVGMGGGATSCEAS